jgi:F0F1-type ATP synthase membrane subunit b/b'
MENLFLLSIAINTDILDTNLINIVLLFAFLFNFLGTLIKKAMLKRKIKILNEVLGAEQNFIFAAKRFNEATLQSKQSEVLITRIDLKTDKVKAQIRKHDFVLAQYETANLKYAMYEAIKYETNRAQRDNQDSLLMSSLANAYNLLRRDLSYNDCNNLIIMCINKLPLFS